MQLKTIFSLASLGMIVSCASGCIPFPHYASPKKDPLRQNVGQEACGEFPAPGRNDREEVLLRWGEPDGVSSNGRRFHYRWKKIVLVWGLPGAFYTWNSGQVWNSYELLIDFDGEGAVIGHEVKTLETGSEIHRR